MLPENAKSVRVALWLWLALTVLAITRGEVTRPDAYRRSPLQLRCLGVAAAKLGVGLAWLALPDRILLQQSNHITGLVLALLGLLLVETIYKSNDSTLQEQ